MKKLINDPKAYVDEALDGLCAAFPGYARTGASKRVIVRERGAAPGQVGIASGGGFGHLPLFAGYVGEGMLTACAVGNVFAGPPADVCAQTIRAAHGGTGVLCVLGNYGGDRMSFQMACDELEDDGITTATVIAADDVASAPPAERQKRRGVAGIVWSYKAAGALAATGAPLERVAAIAKKTSERTRSIGVALSPCLIPGAAAPGFEVPEGTIELGMGIHGEPGLEKRAMESADAVTESMVRRLLDDPVDGATGRVALLVNSLGATPLEELLIVYRAAQRLLKDARVDVRRRYVGHYTTSMEMAGCSLSLLHLDDEIESLLDAPDRVPVLAKVVLEAAAVRRAVARMHAAIGPIRDELNAADRELGDGDTGMTVEQLVSVWHAAAATLPGDVGEALRRLAQETRRASGSSLASVAAIALGAAAKTVAGKTGLDRDELVGALTAATQAIAERSGASPGDKTVLDSLLGIADALRTADDNALNVAIAAADSALVAFRGRECRLGRARMYGARTVGRDDPGMLAAARLLHASREVE